MTCRACALREEADVLTDFVLEEVHSPDGGEARWAARAALTFMQLARVTDHALDCTYIPRHDESFVPPLYLAGKSDAS